MLYHKHVSEPWFSHIQAGRKLIEGRIRKGDFSQMQPGDTVVWWTDRDKQVVEATSLVTAIHHYATFTDYLSIEGISQCLPGLNSLEEALAVYLGTIDQPGYFSVQEESHFGVAAVHFELVESTAA